MSEIKIITEPTVRLVGRLTIDESELTGFLHDERAETWTTDTDNAAQKLVEVAGRLCYKSYAKPRPGGNAGYLDHILEVGHGSVIEHAVYNFIITGVSRSFTHELVRHRAGWAYSQRSQRFCDESEGAFVVPPLYLYDVKLAMDFFEKYKEVHSFDSYQDACDRCWVDTEDLDGLAVFFGLEWLSAVEESHRKYDRMANRWMNTRLGHIEDKTLRRKMAREAARSVLPNATETQIFVTANARALRHFIEARGGPEADAEIRRVALAILAILKAESPNLFGDYTVDQVDGQDVIYTTNAKV